MIIKELEGKYGTISLSVPFSSAFDFHIWVGISKDSENSKQPEPEACTEKSINPISESKISIYDFKKKMSHPKLAKA